MNDFIDVDSLSTSHPVRTTEVAPFVSDRYSKTSLEDLIREVEPMGYRIYNGRGSLTNVARRYQNSSKSQETAAHSVSLRSIYDTDDVIVGKTIVQLFMSDSHDLTKPLRVGMNVWEYWCKNGATRMLPDTGWAFSVKHISINMQAVLNATKLLVSSFPAYLDWVETLKGIKVTTTQAVRFAELASRARFSVNDIVPYADLTLAAYSQQREPTLWNVFQNVQRNLESGNVQYIPHAKNKRKAKAITATGGLVKMNDELWASLEEFTTNEFPSVTMPKPPLLDLDPSKFRIKESTKSKGSSPIVGIPMEFDS